MRILTDEEIAEFEHYPSYEGHDIYGLLKAQHQQDIRDFIKELEAYTFYDDFGGDSAKGFRDRLVEKLNYLLDNTSQL